MIDILFDCDTGHDDAIALMVALAHPDELNLLGITTVAGNTFLENTTRNTLKVLGHLGFSVDLAAGYDKPMRYPIDVQPAAHGDSGMDGPVLADPVAQPVAQHAIEFLRERILRNPKPVVIVAVGPLTNIGLLLRTYPEVKQNIEKICIMGGSLHTGNTLPAAEFNLYHDPDAAAIVFESGLPIVMAGLEVCYAGSILFSEYEAFANGGKASKLVYDILEYFSNYCRERDLTSSPIFDMTTVIQLLHPELFETEMFHIDIETEGKYCRGMTVADTRFLLTPKQKNVEVLMGIKDRDAFIGVLNESLRRLDARCV